MPTVEDMIDQVVAGDLADAKSSFEEIMSDRVNDAIEAEKIAVASALYSSDQLEDDQDDGEEFEDEDLVDEFDELDDEDLDEEEYDEDE